MKFEISQGMERRHELYGRYPEGLASMIPPTLKMKYSPIWISVNNSLLRISPKIQQIIM